MSTDRPVATHPEQLADLWIQRATARDLEGLVALYAPLVSGDLALCGATADGVGRTQVARRETDGRWLRVLDRANPQPAS